MRILHDVCLELDMLVVSSGVFWSVTEAYSTYTVLGPFIDN
jgi:hypothetical protein